MKLKPCPFCGGKATAYKDKYGKICVSCDICGAFIGIDLENGVALVDGWAATYETIEEAAKDWNRRYKPREEQDAQ